MDIQCLNAERDFMILLSLFTGTPQSWEGWSALQIRLESAKEEQQEDALITTKSILESYLRDVEKRAFFCFSSDIHIICNGVPRNILRQVGSQICDLLNAENQIKAKYQIFDLVQDAQIYQQVATSGHENVMSFLGVEEKTTRLKAVNDENTVLHIEEEAYAPPLASSGLIRVLLVEDDPVARWMVRSALKGLCEFATANCANKAFAIYASFQPDVVFLDIDLPDQNGGNVLEWIVRNDPGASVVMFSSNNTLQNIADALTMGAVGFIQKPFIKENFLHYINAHNVKAKAG